MQNDRMSFTERAKRIDEINDDIASIASDIEWREVQIQQWEAERGAVMQYRVDVAEARLSQFKLEKLKDQLLEQ